MNVDWNCVKRLPTDYSDYGGEVERQPESRLGLGVFKEKKDA